ncbi:hypothetical protein BKA59DRAFT_447807 [Fusarium tricinctum]|uniref:Uncharacterized protein n=1 Tax=Fusarium tricinctum TaxID=61284 RepID=A0A8K0WFY7_9HYPO|nr:hypothetical protein BKA59DRAFT_447807 [Fusarium tricinctum]
MGIARLAGLLFLGVVRLLSATYGNLDAASLCCACARSCFRGAEDPNLELYATTVVCNEDRNSLEMMRNNTISNLDSAALSIYANSPRADIRQSYYVALADCKKALVKAVVLYHLERHDAIRQWLPEAIPIMFGGRLPTASDKFRELFTDASPELEVLRKIEQQSPDLLDQLFAKSGKLEWVNMIYVAAIEEHSGNLESAFRWLIKALDEVEASRSKLTDVADRRELLDVIQSAELGGGDGNGDLAIYLAILRGDLREEAESPSRAIILARLHQPHFAANATKLYMAIPEDAIVVHINLLRDGVLILFTDQRMERYVL